MVFLPAGAASPGVSPGTCGQEPTGQNQPDARQRSLARSLVRVLTTGASPLDTLSSNSASRSWQTGRRVSKSGKPAACVLRRRWRRPPHHLALLLQDDGLPGPLPQPQGLVVRGRHQVVPAGADGQAPHLPMMTLRGRFGPVSASVSSVSLKASLSSLQLCFDVSEAASTSGCSSKVASLHSFTERRDPDWWGARGEAHLQRLDVLKLVGVPLLDLLVLPRGEEKMSFGDKLEEHDAAERESVGQRRSELEAGGPGSLWTGTCHREQTWSGDSRRSPDPRSSRFCPQNRWRSACCPGRRQRRQKHRWWLFWSIFSEKAQTSWEFRADQINLLQDCDQN